MKKIIKVTFLLAILFSTCMIALAEGDNTQSVTTASQLKSKGAIVYQNGTDSVVIDSADLYILAEAFDSFKAAVYSQMVEMNTYLTMDDEGIGLTTSEDFYVVHSAPSDIVDPLSINFDTLVEGLAASQSIPSTPAEYGYAEGTSLYKTAEGLLTEEASDGTEIIEIGGATANNLSAGAAAWVDGNLILGTGVDNKAFYNQGYSDGANKVMNSVKISAMTHRFNEAPNKSGTIDVGKGYKAAYIVGVSANYTNSIGSDGNKHYTFVQSYNPSTGVLAWSGLAPNLGGHMDIVRIEVDAN